MEVWVQTLGLTYARELLGECKSSRQASQIVDETDGPRSPPRPDSALHKSCFTPLALYQHTHTASKALQKLALLLASHESQNWADMYGNGAGVSHASRLERRIDKPSLIGDVEGKAFRLTAQACSEQNASSSKPNLRHLSKFFHGLWSQAPRLGSLVPELLVRLPCALVEQSLLLSCESPALLEQFGIPARKV